MNILSKFSIYAIKHSYCCSSVYLSNITNYLPMNSTQLHGLSQNFHGMFWLNEDILPVTFPAFFKSKFEDKQLYCFGSYIRQDKVENVRNLNNRMSKTKIRELL